MEENNNNEINQNKNITNSVEINNSEVNNTISNNMGSNHEINNTVNNNEINYSQMMNSQTMNNQINNINQVNNNDTNFVGDRYTNVNNSNNSNNSSNSNNNNNDIKRKKKKFIILIITFTVLFTIIFTTIFICLTRAYISSLPVTIPMLAKPIIYLYPTEETKVSVELINKEKLTCVYPEYNNGWEVIAKPNGELIDTRTGRSQYALYWEGRNNTSKEITEGFCVKGEETSKFLEEKLRILGLTEREANEFIIYWLPKLEKNNYNLISFETMEEINEDMPLTINPKPDTLIRVMMKFKGINEYQEIKEQKLETPERKGFVAVEWGGTEIQ